jgi:hypothetical protein
MSNYNTWLTDVANLAGTVTTNTALLIEVPNAIAYAENRIYRDLDLLQTITNDTTQVTVNGNRNVAVPTAFFVINEVNVITPAGQTNPEAGTRNQLVKMAKEFLDLAWSNSTGKTVPRLFAFLNQYNIVLGPWPDAAYAVEYVGTQRPAPLSSTNISTFLTATLPDLFEVATMIHISAYQKNFGAQADDPRTAQSWEGQYKELLADADAEELRKRYTGTIRIPPPGFAKMPAAPAAAKQ